jgi:transaldolase
MSDRLLALSSECGQSPWVDNLKRSYINDGTLAQLVSRGIRGVTSNPTIFQKAIAGSADYDGAFAALIKTGKTTEEAYWALVSDDVRGACAILAPVHASSNGVDGYVSLEVSPNLAEDAAGTETAARHLHESLAIPNMMVKIPATAVCVPAIQQMIAEGRDINVTLIFSIDRYDSVIDAYLNGLEAQVTRGATDLSGTASVASFFISRVDTEIDRRLDKIATPAALALRGKGAVAQAVLAYQLFLQRFSGPRWERLAALGARPQRPLWASTSTKNPAFPDTLYVDSLIAPNTVNTLPEPTIEAFADHGTATRTIDSVDAIVDAQETMLGLADVGVDLGDVAKTLEAEGVASFVKSFDELLATLETRSHELK